MTNASFCHKLYLAVAHSHLYCLFNFSSSLLSSDSIPINFDMIKL